MNGHVLIIDDDAALANTVQMLLEDWGIEADTARTGEEGLALLRAQHYDILITDLQMPGISGQELLTQVHGERPEMPIIMLTGHGSVRSAVEAMRSGAFDYIQKPLNEEEFEVVIGRALDHARLRHENTIMRAELASAGSFGHRMIGDSPALQHVFRLINRIARADSTVLITGETGTGKELVAQTIHYKSPRAGKPLLACNCAALNTNLLESELFGHEKGAFTGATTTRRGRFEEADGGTLFLDEIGETSREFQAALLRVLQEGELERVGGTQKIKVDVRVIASTNRDIEREIREGRFREDLYYRLCVTPIHLPPLRERREDIVPLARYFLARYTEQYGGAPKQLSPAAEEYLLRQEWTGNVREVKHAVERAVILTDRALLEPADLRLDTARPGAGQEKPLTLEAQLDRTTREYVLRMLEQTGWHKQQAAELLGIDRATLYRILKKHRIESSET